MNCDNKKVFILPSHLSFNDCVLCSLWHPKMNEAKYFITINNNFEILEIQGLQTNGTYSSWFIDQQVISDGTLLLCTPIDPLFIFLYLFSTYSKDSYKNIQDIITELNNNNWNYLRRAENNLSFDLLCDKQEILELNYWKLNKNKVLEWLNNKFNNIKNKLKDIDYKDSHLDFGKNETNDEKEEKLNHIVIGFLSEYLMDEWIIELKNSQGIKDNIINDNRKITTMDDIVNYSSQKPISSNGFAFGVTRKPTKGTKSSKIETKGMGNLSNFFKKK